MTSPIELFRSERAQRIASQRANFTLRSQSIDWIAASMAVKYVYNFECLGRPIIQYPQDVIAVQDLIWRVKPDFIIETGIAHGGSLVLSASMLALLDYCDAVESCTLLDPRHPKRRVLGIDIDIRAHNREAIEAHPLAGRIDMLQGSSIAPEIVAKVRERAVGKRVLVFLDSMHTHAHVLAELEAYAPLVASGSYCVAFDTFVEDMPEGFFANRPWDVGNNPKTAVHEFLKHHPEFEIDEDMDAKLLITVAPDGWLRRR